MFSKKQRSIYKYFLLPIFLVLFVTCKAVLFFHSFSHQLPVKNYVINVENNIIEKIISTHFANFTDSSKKAENCSLCEISNFQNQLLPFTYLFLAILAFYLAFVSRDFNRVKLSYLLSSYSSRAPPQIS